MPPPMLLARRSSRARPSRGRAGGHQATGKKLAPVTNAVASTTGAAYEAGAMTRRTLNWRAPTIGPNHSLLPSLTTMRDRSRAAVRNDGNAKAIIDRLVTNIVGDCIKPHSLAPDPDFVKAVHALWFRWVDESDADGLLPWDGQVAQGCRAWLEGGETFLRLRPRLASDGLSVPLQVQIIEPELCPHTHTLRLANGNRIRAGIQLDAIGRRTAYWMYKEHPGDFMDSFDAALLRPIAADSIIHLFDPLRPGQMRGLPHLHASLIPLYELDKFTDATLLKQQLQNMFVAFLKRTGASDQSLHPLTGQPLSTTTDRATLSLEPGTFQELDIGEDVTFSNPAATDSGYAEFTKAQLRAACTAAGVPYEVVTGDLGGLNDRIVRVILHEFRRRLQATQHHILAFQVCRRIWRAWMDRAVLTGALPVSASVYAADPEPWLRVKWSPQSWPYLHPVQDVEAQVAAIRAGFTSRSAVVSEQGEDAEQIDQEQADDNTRADESGLRYDSDGRQAKTPKNSTDEPTTDSPTPEPAAVQNQWPTLHAEDLARVDDELARVRQELADLKAAPKGPLVAFGRPAMRKRVEYNESGAIVALVEEPTNLADGDALRVDVPSAVGG